MTKAQIEKITMLKTMIAPFKLVALLSPAGPAGQVTLTAAAWGPALGRHPPQGVPRPVISQRFPRSASVYRGRLHLHCVVTHFPSYPFDSPGAFG
jgi:hypothetical protein